MEALGNLEVECFLVLPTSTRQPGEGLIDVSGDFHRLYGVRGEFLYLIRPDGYVGLFQRPLDECVLQAYMAKLFRVDATDSAFAAQAIRVPGVAGR